MNVSEVERQVWRQVIPDLPYQDGAGNLTGFFQKWRALRQEGKPIGVPCTYEQGSTNGRSQQGFTSGAVLEWNGSAVVFA